MNKTFYTPQEYADIAGVDRRTVYRWIKEGRIQAEKPFGGKVYIPEVEVPTFLRDK